MLSKIKNKIKNKIRKYIINIIDDRIKHQIESSFANKFDEYFIISSQIQQFQNAPEDMLSTYIEGKTIITDIVKRFELQGIPVIKEEVKINEFEKWLKQFPELVSYYDSHGDVKIEKLLEHYLSSKYLDVSSDVVYIDIAAAGSPFAAILDKKYNGGGTFYSQDLIYKHGINGNKIGGDAGNMPLQDNFSDIMALHCAFECFQGNSDVNFVKEANRVLKQNGRFGIIPLYVDNEYFVKTGPKYDKRKVSIEQEVKWIWRDDKYDQVPFSRHYSPEVFKTRIIANIQGMKTEIIYFTNLDEIQSYFIGSRIYCYFMFRAYKN